MRWAGRVRWCTSRVAYAEAGPGEVIALHGHEIEPFPFSVAVVGGWPGGLPDPGTQVALAGGALWVGDRPHEAVVPSPAPVAPAIGRARALCSRLSACRSVRRRRVAIAPLIESVVDALRRGDEHGAAELLVGWGPGLTPTGDDVLVGLAVADALCGGGAGAARLIELATRDAAERTTFLSRALLEAAHAGRFAPALVALAEADDHRARSRAVARVERIGSTSGTDLLVGVELGLCLVLGGGTAGRCRGLVPS